MMVFVYELFFCFNWLNVNWFVDCFYFFVVVVCFMCYIIVDYVCECLVIKCGSGIVLVYFDDVQVVDDQYVEIVLVINEVFECFFDIDLRFMCVVECCFFMGLMVVEMVEVFEVL